MHIGQFGRGSELCPSPVPRSSAASSRGCHGAATQPHPAAEHTHHWHEVQAPSTSALTAAGPLRGRTTCSSHMVTSSGTRRIGAGARSLLAQPAAGKLPRPQGAPPEPPHSAATRLGGPGGPSPDPVSARGTRLFVSKQLPVRWEQAGSRKRE